MHACIYPMIRTAKLLVFIAIFCAEGRHGASILVDRNNSNRNLKLKSREVANLTMSVIPHKSIKSSKLKSNKAVNQTRLPARTSAPSKRRKKSPHEVPNRSMKPTAAIIPDLTPLPSFYATIATTMAPSTYSISPSTESSRTNIPSSKPTEKPIDTVSTRPSAASLTPRQISSMPTVPYFTTKVTVRPTVRATTAIVGDSTPAPSYSRNPSGTRHSTSPTIQSSTSTTSAPSTLKSLSPTKEDLSTPHPASLLSAKPTEKPIYSEAASAAPKQLSSTPTVPYFTTTVTARPTVRATVVIVDDSTTSPSYSRNPSSTRHSTSPSIHVHASISPSPSTLKSKSPTWEDLSTIHPASLLSSKPTENPIYTVSTRPSEASSTPKHLSSMPTVPTTVTARPTVRFTAAIVDHSTPTPSYSSIPSSARYSIPAPSTSKSLSPTWEDFSTRHPAKRLSSKPTEKPVNIVTSIPQTGPTSLTILSYQPTARPTASIPPSSASFTSMPSYFSSGKPTLSSSLVLTLAPAISNNCIISAKGDFGNLSTHNTLMFVDYKYELTTNVTVMNESSISLGMVTAIVEKSLSSLLVPFLFKSCESFVQLPSHRSRRIESDDVLGISASPQDILLLDACSSTADYDEQCTVVNGRLTLYITALYTNPSKLVSNISTTIASAMNDGTLASSTVAIIRLHYLNGFNGIPLDSPLLSENHALVTSWASIVGAIFGVGVILLIAVGMRQFIGRKANKKNEPEIADDDSVSVASPISLSAIWNEKAMDGLEKARSFNHFVSSQPVIRLRSQPFSPQIAPRQQGLLSVAVECAATRVKDRQLREGYDCRGGSVFSSSDEGMYCDEDGVMIKRSSSFESLSTGEWSGEHFLSSRLSISSCSDSEYDYCPSKQLFKQDVLNKSTMSNPSIANFASSSLKAILSTHGDVVDHSPHFYDEQVVSPSESSFSNFL